MYESMNTLAAYAEAALSDKHDMRCEVSKQNHFRILEFVVGTTHGLHLTNVSRNRLKASPSHAANLASSPTGIKLCSDELGDSLSEKNIGNIGLIAKHFRRSYVRQRTLA
jgi:hypothetical protein